MYPVLVKVIYNSLLKKADREFTAHGQDDILSAVAEVGVDNIETLEIKPICECS